MNRFESINLRSLRIFIQVYDVQNFSFVARREGMSASQVSRVIQGLEESLGQQLFYRNTRAVIPTENGHLFIKHALAITSNLDDARRELSERLAGPSGVVRINAPVFFGQKHIAPALANLSERYPHLEIDLVLTDDYIDPLKEAVDVIFRIGVLMDSSLHARVFGQQHYHLVASPAYIQKYGMLNSPEELKDHKCLVYGGTSGLNRWFFKMIAVAKEDPAQKKQLKESRQKKEWRHYPISPLMRSNNAESLLTAALNGMGIVLFPDWLVGDKIQSGELVQILSHVEASIKAAPQNITAIYPNARHPSLNARAVIDYYVEVFGTPLYWQLK